MCTCKGADPVKAVPSILLDLRTATPGEAAAFREMIAALPEAMDRGDVRVRMGWAMYAIMQRLEVPGAARTLNVWVDGSLMGCDYRIDVTSPPRTAVAVATTGLGHMSDKPVPTVCHILLYANLLPRLIKVAREQGYALAVHGSVVNDLDLIAVPWVEEAKDAETLVVALCEACTGKVPLVFPEGTPQPTKWVARELRHQDPSARPHGRMTYTIGFGGCVYIDLTVMPLLPKGTCLRQATGQRQYPCMHPGT